MKKIPTKSVILEVSRGIEIRAYSMEGLTIRDVEQNIILEIFPSEIDDLIEKLKEAKKFIFEEKYE